MIHGLITGVLVFIGVQTALIALWAFIVAAVRGRR